MKVATETEFKDIATKILNLGFLTLALLWYQYLYFSTHISFWFLLLLAFVIQLVKTLAPWIKKVLYYFLTGLLALSLVVQVLIWAGVLHPHLIK